MVLGKDSACKSIKIVNKEIKMSKSVKLLGLTIQNKLQFDVHLNKICKVASANIKSNLI